jgi:hypothetical protein
VNEERAAESREALAASGWHDCTAADAMSLEPNELEQLAAYRTAYAQAADELWRLRLHGTTVEQLEQLKARLLDEAPADDELAREAVGDAVAGRRPRY